jgi:thiol-disulfide isomerase/thioredoxin
VEAGEDELNGARPPDRKRPPAATAPAIAAAAAAATAAAAVALAVVLAAGGACDRRNEAAVPRAPALVTGDIQAIRERLAPGGGLRVVNFWAMWCQPCVAELPEFIALAGAVRPRGVRVIGVSLDLAVPGDRAASETRLRDFLRRRAMTYENVLFSGTVSSLLDEFDLPGAIPYTMIVADDGAVLWRHEGATTRERIEAELARAGE